MVFTYDISTDRGKVRLLIGDTDSTVALFQDAEVDAMLTLYGSVSSAAATLAEGLAAKYGRLVTQTVDGASFDYGERAKHFLALAQRIRAQGDVSAGALGLPVVTGVSLGEMDAVDADTDRTPSQFRIGMNDESGGDEAIGD